MFIVDHQRLPSYVRNTQNTTKNMNDVQIFEKAQRHLEDALEYRHPRPQSYWTNQDGFFIRLTYNIRVSTIWKWLLFIISYAYINSMVRRYTLNPLQMVLRGKNQFQIRQQILFATQQLTTLVDFYQNYTLPMRIIRALLPICYDSFIFKSFWALIWCYKDILNYLLFYTMIIVGFSLVANQIIEIQPGTHYDNFRQNYGQISKLIFVIYVMSSYDAYPDNQHVALQSSIYNYAFFIVFIFFNVFFFVVIPATIIFNSFRQTRKNILLIDQIKQKNSLILCYYTLLNTNQYLPRNYFTKFLSYVYKGNLKYFKCIREITKRINKNNNSYIVQIYIFTNIIHSDSKMNIPKHTQWSFWTNLTNMINEHYSLQSYLQCNTFKLVNILLIVITFINCLLYMSTKSYLFQVIDTILMVLFIVEVLLKIISLGFQKYCKDKWNEFDIGLVILITIMKISSTYTHILLKMIRIFRITAIIQNILQSTKPIKRAPNSTIQQLLGQMAVIIPIVLKFFPLFMIVYYILGVVGMQAFKYQTQIKPQQSPYSFYNKYSNFNSLMGTQFIMVQILVEAGWSMVAFDHAYRYQNYFLVMIYFVACHVITVLILAALMKGLVWQVYYTIQLQYTKRNQSRIKSHSQLTSITQQIHQYQQIKHNIEKDNQIIPNTLIKLKLIDNKQDLIMIDDIKSKIKLLRTIKSKYLQKRSMSIEQMEKLIIQWENAQLHPLSKEQQLEDQFYQYYNVKDTQQILEKNIKSLLKEFHHQIQQQPINQQYQIFINTKIQLVQQSKYQIKYLLYQVNKMLNIQTSQKTLKYQILRNLNTTKKISLKNKQYLQLLLHPIEQPPNSYQIIRQIFSDDDNQLQQKFQAQYMKDVYGFKQLPKLSNFIQLQSKLLYSLKVILRYPQVPLENFFRVLCKIQELIVSQLLPHGSLCKFIFQMIDQNNGRHFVIEVKLSGSIEIHFIKHQQWILTNTMLPQHIYSINDIFRIENGIREDISKDVQNLYRNFGTLALCNKQNEPFFEYNPQQRVYNGYHFYLDAAMFNHSSKFNISKISMVIISNICNRTFNTAKCYPIKNLLSHKSGDQNQRQSFKYDENQYQTYEKLSNLSNKAQPKEGNIPKQLILEIMTEVKEIIKYNCQTIVDKVEKVLNENFNA